MQAQQDIRRLLLYWVGLWVPMALFFGLLANPLTNEFIKAFWNPPVWLAMVPVSGALAWLICRYRQPLNLLWTKVHASGIFSGLYWGMMGWNLWERGHKFLGGFGFLLMSIVIVSRIHRWHDQWARQER